MKVELIDENKERNRDCEKESCTEEDNSKSKIKYDPKSISARDLDLLINRYNDRYLDQPYIF